MTNRKPLVQVSGDIQEAPSTDTLLINVSGNASTVTTNANLTGDVTSVGNATILATVNSNVGSFGSATQGVVTTVNGKGLTTAIANVTITPGVASITGLGTGVATALAINVGTAGAVVVNGGALGTPSSGVATNLTGSPTFSTLTLSGAALSQKPVTANSSTAYTIDQANGAQFDITLNGTTPVLTLQAVTASESEEISVTLIQDGTGGRLPTWSNVTWAAGVSPTINTPIAARTYLKFISDGVTWTGYAVPQGTGTGAVVLAVAPTISTINLTGITTIGGGQILNTRVVTAAGAITVTSADYIVIVNKTVGAATAISFPSGVTNTVFIVKDGKGDANANNITITPAAGNVDGSSTYVINANYGSATFVYNGTQWNVI